CADLVLVTPHDVAEVRSIGAEVAEWREAAGHPSEELRVLADVVVFLGATTAEAEDRKARLDELFGHTYRSDALVLVGAAEALVELIEEWSGAGIDGFRLRPAGLPGDLGLIGTTVVPELRRRGLFPAT